MKPKYSNNHMKIKWPRKGVKEKRDPSILPGTTHLLNVYVMRLSSILCFSLDGKLLAVVLLNFFYSF